jgi:hypothetical protein
MATAGAYTLKGNNTAASATLQDFTIAGLTSKAAPVAADAILISDSAASGAFKQVPWSSLPGGTAGEIPSGSVMLFWQAAAPTGWTQVTTQNDKALRVVSGTGGVAGGTNAFSTVQAQTVTGSHTLALSELPTGITSPWSSNITVYAAGTAGNGVPYSNSASWAVMIVTYGTGYYIPYLSTNVGFSYSGSFYATNSATATSNNTGAGAHTHPIIMAIQYIDIILASKN